MIYVRSSRAFLTSRCPCASSPFSLNASAFIHHSILSTTYFNVACPVGVLSGAFISSGIIVHIAVQNISPTVLNPNLVSLSVISLTFSHEKNPASLSPAVEVGVSVVPEIDQSGV